MATINYSLRVDETDKQRAEQVFKSLGMTFSTGINIYLKAVGRQRRIPFDLAVDDPVRSTSMAETIDSLRADAAQNDASELTMDEVDTEIVARRFRHMVKAKLDESEVAANDPSVKRYTHEEIFAPLREKYGYTVQG